MPNAYKLDIGILNVRMRYSIFKEFRKSFELLVEDYLSENVISRKIISIEKPLLISAVKVEVAAAVATVVVAAIETAAAVTAAIVADAAIVNFTKMIPVSFSTVIRKIRVAHALYLKAQDTMRELCIIQ